MLNGLFENTSHLPNEVLKNLETIQNNQTNLQNVGQQYLTTNSTYNDQEEPSCLCLIESIASFPPPIALPPPYLGIKT